LLAQHQVVLHEALAVSENGVENSDRVVEGVMGASWVQLTVAEVPTVVGKGHENPRRVNLFISTS